MSERFDVQLTRDNVLVRFRNRLVATLVGKAADEIRAAYEAGDDAAVQLLVARKTGNFKRGPKVERPGFTPGRGDER